MPRASSRMSPNWAAIALLAVCVVLPGCGGSSPGPPASPSTPPSPTPTPTPSPTFPLLVAAGDIACGPVTAPSSVTCRQADTADLVVSLQPTVVLQLGDLQYEQATYEEFLAYYDRSWGRFRPISRPALGNHEYQGHADARGYFDYWNGVGAQNGVAGERGRGFYSFDLGGWHIVSLNSNCGRVGGCGVGSVQERWLKADLAANPATCTLAFWHHPRFSSGRSGSAPDTAALWQDLSDAGAELVLAGNDHSYERFAPQSPAARADPLGIREFVVGTGGRSLYEFPNVLPNSEVRNHDSFGVLALRLKPTGYDWEFVPIPGNSFRDSGSGQCH
jgi:acid phosphatase type 7